MSSFTEPLIVQKVIETQKKKFFFIPYKSNKNYWITTRDFRYYVGELNSEDYIDVPSGTKTDFASVPRIFWSILPPDGVYTQAAVLHDYMYKTRIRSKEEADKIFYESMGVLGVKDWKRKVMLVSLQAFGFIAWNKNKNEKK